MASQAIVHTLCIKLDESKIYLRFKLNAGKFELFFLQLRTVLLLLN
jgi:hypothetical protein